MPPKLFYKVPPDNYLFNKKATDNAHEEKVRQWVLYELMSTYGYSIQQINIEQYVKMGSRPQSADIVITTNEKIQIVIECKRESDKKLDKGLDQAQGYAERLRAEFAVYSNGKDWLVTRHINGAWEVCIDIPTSHQADGEYPLDHYLYAVDKIRPILYWLHRDVPKEETTKYIKCIQSIFYGSTMAIHGIDTDLSKGISELAESFYYENKFYPRVFSTAISSFRRFAHKIKYDQYLNADQQSAKEEAKYTRLKLHDLIERSDGITTANLFATRLSVALLEYAEDFLYSLNYSKPFDNKLPRAVNVELFKLLDYLLKVNLNISLPDQLNTMEVNSVQYASESAWKNFGSEEKTKLSNYWFNLKSYFT